MTVLTDGAIKSELLRVKEETERLTGQKTMNIFVRHDGMFNERTMKIAKDEGYYHIFWSLAYKDWIVNEQKGAAYAHGASAKANSSRGYFANTHGFKGQC